MSRGPWSSEALASQCRRSDRVTVFLLGREVQVEIAAGALATLAESRNAAMTSMGPAAPPWP
jgi:hypothetical protein